MKRLTLQIFNSIAKRRGGRCLSTRYVNSRIPLSWQCAIGHRWRALPNNVKHRRSWCPSCAGVKRLTLREMRVLAKHRGGDCLSKQYVNDDTKLTWRCAAGHEWRAVPVDVKRGSWCPYCARTVRLTLQELQAEANRRGGRCLSRMYANAEKHLRWKCAVGHEWEATPASIRQGTWCPYCVHNRKLNLEEMQQIGRERGGRCVSKRYINNSYEPYLGMWQRASLEGFARQREGRLKETRDVVLGMLQPAKGISPPGRYRKNEGPREETGRTMSLTGIREFQDPYRVGMLGRTPLACSAGCGCERLLVSRLRSESAIDVGRISNYCAPSWWEMPIK